MYDLIFNLLHQCACGTKSTLLLDFLEILKLSELLANLGRNVSSLLVVVDKSWTNI